MIEFKNNVEEVLPYNRQQYIDFLGEENDADIKWYGVSFQLPGVDGKNKASLNKYLEVYEPLFRDVVAMLDSSSRWIVNHDDKDLNWFPDDSNSLSRLRSLFNQNAIPNTFRGALVFSKDELLSFSRELISYPYSVFDKDGALYKNLDISYSELPVIIKISGHLNIDFLSTDKAILTKIVNENISAHFIIKEYRSNAVI